MLLFLVWTKSIGHHYEAAAAVDQGEALNKLLTPAVSIFEPGLNIWV
jgi:hypothetical protein